MPTRDSLRELLREYLPTDEREGAFRARMLSLLDDDGGRLFSRETFVPGHFTASAFVLSPEQDALYLIHHAKLGLWLQPGGHVEEHDEDLLAAARREVEEEAGLASAPLHPGALGVFDLDIHPIPARRDEPAHEHLDVRFLFLAPSRDALLASAEVRGGRWVLLSEVGDAGSDDSVLRAARKARSLATR